MMFGFALSCLQDFVYDLTPETPARAARPTVGGRDTFAARRLRIRSAVLTLVPGLVAWELKQAEPDAEIVYLGGGKLLMKASTSAVARLTPKLEELYDWLVSASAGKLGAYWREIESGLSKEGLQKLLEELAQAKWRAGRDGAWQSSAVRIQLNKPDGLGNRDWEGKEGAEFGRRQDLVGFAVGSGGWPIGPWKVKPVTQNPKIVLAGRGMADVEVSIPTYSPKDTDGSVAELFRLAEEGGGAAYLALVKLDGDGIGALMQSSLKESLDEYRRVSAELRDFFGPTLMDLLEKRYPRIYLVYSGGDDLVATGYFDDVLRAAMEIENRYRGLGRGSVSAGVSFYARQSPILKAVEAAETQLQKAKELRNCVCIAGCVLGWEELKRTVAEVDGLVAELKKDLKRGTLQLLRHLGEPWLPEATEALPNNKYRSIPQFHYMKSRRDGWRTEGWPVEASDSLSHSSEMNPTGRAPPWSARSPDGEPRPDRRRNEQRLSRRGRRPRRVPARPAADQLRRNDQVLRRQGTAEEGGIRAMAEADRRNSPN